MKNLFQVAGIENQGIRGSADRVYDRSATPSDFGHIRRAIELALRLGNPNAARRAVTALLQHFPDAIAPVIMLGQALLDSDAPRAAIEQFHRALKLNPLDAVAWAGLAGALARCGQHDASQAALLAAALHDPLSSESLAPGIAASPAPFGMGVVYLRRGHALLAVPELAAAIDRHPVRDDLRLYYIEALRRTGDLAEARRHLRMLEPANGPDLPFLLLQAALAVTPAEAATIHERCARYDPDGQIVRRFFAPDHPPWSIHPAPVVPWDSELESITVYMAHVAASPKAVVTSDERRTHTTQPATLPLSEAKEPGTQHASVEDRRPADQPDPDVLAIVATAERLRYRLAEVGGTPRALVAGSDSQGHIQILLAHKAALVRRYGDAGFAAIERRLQALAAALRLRGVNAYCCYSDAAASLQLDDQLAFAPVAQEAPAIRDLVRAMADGLAQQRRRLGTLLLIGGDEIIPFHRLPNPLSDGDEVILSDNPYGTDDAGYLLPQWTVGRIPDGAGDDPTLLLALLDQMVDYHHGREPYRQRAGDQIGSAILGIRWGAQTARALTASGYSAEVWRETSREVLDALRPDSPLVYSPPLDADTIDADASEIGRLLYLNLHGAAGLPNWYGQAEAPLTGSAARLPVALRPDHFANNAIAGGLVISEACYGLDLAARTAQTSIPLRALLSGALACVGATVNAYGSFAPPLIGADLLCQRLLAQLQRGASIGEALREARLEFAQTMYRRQGYLDDVDIKTLAEFVLLGDPWASMAASAPPPAPWPVSKLSSIERVPKPRPKAVILEEQVSRDLVQRARAALKSLLPGATTIPLSITAQPTLRQMRKGEPEQEFVFSAQASRPTADGYQLSQTAHVTLNERAVVKVALTR